MDKYTMFLILFQAFTTLCITSKIGRLIKEHDATEEISTVIAILSFSVVYFASFFVFAHFIRIS